MSRAGHARAVDNDGRFGGSGPLLASTDAVGYKNSQFKGFMFVYQLGRVGRDIKGRDLA